MKTTTEYYYRFKNAGTPDDTEVGKATWPQMARALVLWLQRVTLNGRITVEYQRTSMGLDKASDGDAEIEDIFAEIFDDDDANAGGDNGPES